MSQGLYPRLTGLLGRLEGREEAWIIPSTKAKKWQYLFCRVSPSSKSIEKNLQAQLERHLKRNLKLDFHLHQTKPLYKSQLALQSWFKSPELLNYLFKKNYPCIRYSQRAPSNDLGTLLCRIWIIKKYSFQTCSGYILKTSCWCLYLENCYSSKNTPWKL